MQAEVYGPGFENGAFGPRGHSEVKEITFGYPLGLVEIVICWGDQVKPLINSLLLPNPFFGTICFFRSHKSVNFTPG